MITGTIEINMDTIHNTNLEGDELQPVLTENHLKSDDFFFTKMFPKAVFNLKEAKRIEPGWSTAQNYHVRGELNLKGVSAGLEFDKSSTPHICCSVIFIENRGQIYFLQLAQSPWIIKKSLHIISHSNKRIT